MWDLDRGELVRTLEGHDKRIRDVAFSPDGTFIVSGHNDCIPRVWDAQTSLLIGELVGHQNWLKAVGVSGDSRWIATGASDGLVRIWDTKDLGTVLRLDLSVGQPAAEISALKFRPEGAQLLTAADELELWDLSRLTGALRIEVSDGSRTLVWDQGDLESAGSVTGPWLPVEEAVSPWQMDTQARVRFYRVHVTH